MHAIIVPPIAIRTCPEDVPSIPPWFAEVVALARHFTQQGYLDTLSQHRVDPHAPGRTHRSWVDHHWQAPGCVRLRVVPDVPSGEQPLSGDYSGALPAARSL
jgi:hypothetical protein